MKRSLILALSLAVASILLMSLGVQFVSSAPSAQDQSDAPGVPRSPGMDIVVTSTANDGYGTLRWAMANAGSGDTIRFNTDVFPPAMPATISVTYQLPSLVGSVTIDASNAGVILDGSGIGLTPEAVLVDDVSLTLDGGPDLIINGDFSTGLGHWCPWDDGPGATRSLNGSNFTSSPHSYEWSTVAHAGDSHTVYNTTDTADLFDDWPYYDGSTVWMPATGGSAAEMRFWFRYGGIGTTLRALFPDGHEESIGGWWFEWEADWTERVVSETLPADAIGVALEFDHTHPERWASGFSVSSSDNAIRGLQIVNFPGSGIDLSDGAQNNIIGGDRGIDAGPMGQGNLISSNGGNGVAILDTGTISNTLSGNFIGTNIDGTAAASNAHNGVFIGDGPGYNVIGGVNASPGGLCSGECNLISGNALDGVAILEGGIMSNTVSGNFIGTNISGTVAVPNAGNGVSIAEGEQYTVIGGDTPGEGNLISGNGGGGVWIVHRSTMYNTVTGNFIGTDASGTLALGNKVGLEICDRATHNTIGGTTAGETNVIAGSAKSAIHLCNGAAHNRVLGNYLGTDVTGVARLGNGEGVGIENGAQQNTIGPGNLIAYNIADGVQIISTTTLSNTVTQNSIHFNGEQGIDNVNGGNLELPPPVIVTVTIDLISGSTVTGTACSSCTVEVFTDDDDEGRIYWGSTTADALGDFTFVGNLRGAYVTATATDAAGNTSEFSSPVSFMPERVYLPLLTKS
jgi:hypothetical protein